MLLSLHWSRYLHLSMCFHYGIVFAMDNTVQAGCGLEMYMNIQ